MVASIAIVLQDVGGALGGIIGVALAVLSFYLVIRLIKYLVNRLIKK